MAAIQLTILGSGTSMGVPTLGCHCAVCESSDPRDKRTRASALLAWKGHNVVIDTTPDFRFQALRAKLDRLDAVIYTHAHADHIMGMDDIRPFNFHQRAPIPLYGSEETLERLREQFNYVFREAPMGATVPSVDVRQIDGPIRFGGVEILPVPAMHGPTGVLGFRIRDAAYLTDFSSVPESSKALLTGLDDLVLSALRDAPHVMHSTVANSLALVEELKPKRAWFTHIAHDLGHEKTNSRLPEHVRLAYDGLSFEVRG
ncbi:MAG TPA: MBL fold metallo-hydrolase [Candidatus Acidoferrales bacterium]|nr:MBL fold metallo-hydrolase [Candidatus Acidoferrales bacterium]